MRYSIVQQNRPSLQAPMHDGYASCHIREIGAVTEAHMDMFRSILTEWDVLHIGLLINSPHYNISKGSFRRFYRLCNRNWRKNINKFSIEERHRMLTAALSASALEPRVLVNTMNRPEYDRKRFNTLYPESSFDLVFPRLGNKNEPFEEIRQEAFAKILKRTVHYVYPSTVFHLSDMVMHVKKEEDWHKYIPEGAVEVFLSINGPERVNG
jgi:nicotinamide mononucleotide adenylyltransferase